MSAFRQQRPYEPRRLRVVLVGDAAFVARPHVGTGVHDLSTSKRYCGIECYPQWMVVSGFVGSIAQTNPFELAVAWPKLTVDVASALFDSAWSDHGGAAQSVWHFEWGPWW
jgi:hypothetical protein